MLKVWIPGTTDTRDQGLGGTTWANSGVTINSSGKLGKCLYSGSGNMTTSNFSLSTKWSYSCWWKDSNTSAGWQYIFLLHNGTQNDSNSQMAFLSYPTQSRCEVCSNGKWYSTQAYTPGTWNHIAATYDGTTCKVYFNGIYTTSFTPGQTVTGTNLQIFKSANVYLNDLRIWDNEVISAKEIEIISRGLVLHYPLNREGFGADNYITNSNVSITTGSNTTMRTTSSLPEGTVVTASCRVDADNVVWDDTASYGRVGMELNGFTKTAGGKQYVGAWAGKVLNDGVNICEAFTGSFHGIVSKTVTLLGTMPANHLVGIYIQGVKSGTVKVSNPKLEVGGKLTPWIPATTDSLYSAMGLNTGIVHDVSGFGHNLELVTESGTALPEYLSDTPRYNVCTKMNGANQYLRCISPTIEAKTASLWVKTGYKGNAAIFTDPKSKLGFGLYGGYIIAACDGYTTTFVLSGFKYNQWNHIVVVKNDDNSRQLYINGVAQTVNTNKSDSWSDAHNYLVLFRRGYSNATAIPDCMMSDFRLYATQLTQEQILELYQTAASLANNGALIGYEYVEV